MRAEPGVGHVTLVWDPVPGAVGYVVHHGRSAGDLTPLDHGGGDLLVVPALPYPDSRAGAGGWYAVAPIERVEDAPGAPGPAVHAEPLPVGPRSPVVDVEVDAADRLGPLPRPWRACVGSEHLSHLLSRDRTGGEVIGEGLEAALRRVHDDLGVLRVRAHGTLGDDLGVCTENGSGTAVHDFSRLDAVLDRVLATGLRPVLELGFTPRALARRPWHEITPAGVADPPHDLDRWGALVEDLVRHLRERFGDAELEQGWAVEIWNEPNLECFWTGDQGDYLDLWTATAAAVRQAHPTLPVAGPATAAVGWLDAVLAHVVGTGAALDVLTPHAYGIAPLDVRPVLARHGREATPVWWTEWGPTPTHFAAVNDHPWTAAFTARGLQAAARAGAAVACWVASDHFEELGRPPRLVHGGFGLLSVGGLAKPRYWALHALERLGQDEIRSGVTGDGAGSMVQAWAGVDDVPGRVAVAVWNGTLQQHDWAVPRPDLARTVRLRVRGLAPGTWTVRHHRVDGEHAHLARHAADLGVDDWPDDEQWAALRRLDRMAEIPCSSVEVGGAGTAQLELDLPTSALSLVELDPQEGAS